MPVVASPRSSRSGLRWGFGLAAVLFGIATVIEGGNVLFGSASARADAGNFVPFVLIFNFCAGFLYVAAGIGAIARQRWSVGLARILAAGTVMVFIAFVVSLSIGRPFEMRTVVAMSIRSAFWITQALVLSRLLLSKLNPPTDASPPTDLFPH